MIERRERLTLRKNLKSEKTLGDTRGITRRDRNEKVFARPNGLRENAEYAISCRGYGPAGKKKEVPGINGNEA